MSLRKVFRTELLREFGSGRTNRQPAVATAAATASDAVEEVSWEKAKPFQSIPGPRPLPIPYFGNFWRFLKFGPYGNVDATVWQTKLRDNYGEMVRLTGLGKQDMVFLYDPVDIEKMHRNESVWPIRQGLESLNYYQEHLRPDVYAKTKGLPNLQGEKWHEVRSAVNPTMMQPQGTKIYVQPIVKIANEFIERIRRIRDDRLEMPEDFANELNKWSLESTILRGLHSVAIAFVALDIRMGCLEDDVDENSRGPRLTRAVLQMFDSFFYLDIRPSLWKFVSTEHWRTFVKTMDTITDIVHGCVTEKVEALTKAPQNGNSSPRSVLEALLNSQNPKFAVVMAMDMLVAGVDTTSNGVASVLSLLASNPDKQEKLFQELKTLIPNKDSELTAESLAEMKYLKATIKETLRMKPVAPANSRTTVKDLTFRGYQVPKGTVITSIHHVICMDERYFKEPQRFMPERWLKSEKESEFSTSKVNPFAYLPFGFGPRMCVGRRFAQMEIEVIIAKIIRNFKLSYHYGDMEWSTILLTRPSKPLKFRMEDRPN